MDNVPEEEVKTAKAIQAIRERWDTMTEEDVAPLRTLVALGTNLSQLWLEYSLAKSDADLAETRQRLEAVTKLELLLKAWDELQNIEVDDPRRVNRD